MNSLILFGSVIAIAFLLAAVLMPLEVAGALNQNKKYALIILQIISNTGRNMTMTRVLSQGIRVQTLTPHQKCRSS
jgi:hypothetical protein